MICVDHIEKLQALLTEYNTLKAEIPAQFRVALNTSIERIDLALRPGLVTVTWTSLGVELYFDRVTAALAELSLVVKKV